MEALVDSEQVPEVLTAHTPVQGNPPQGVRWTSPEKVHPLEIHSRWHAGPPSGA